MYLESSVALENGKCMHEISPSPPSVSVSAFPLPDVPPPPAWRAVTRYLQYGSPIHEEHEISVDRSHAGLDLISWSTKMGRDNDMQGKVGEANAALARNEETERSIPGVCSNRRGQRNRSGHGTSPVLQRRKHSNWRCRSERSGQCCRYLQQRYSPSAVDTTRRFETISSRLLGRIHHLQIR